VSPCKLLIPLVSFETENKSVFNLLLLRTGLILLQFLFFSPSNLLVIVFGLELQESEGKQFDDDDFRGKSLRTNLIQKNFVEFNASVLILQKFILILYI
jgi:hypothetical protein